MKFTGQMLWSHNNIFVKSKAPWEHIHLGLIPSLTRWLLAKMSNLWGKGLHPFMIPAFECCLPSTVWACWDLPPAPIHRKGEGCDKSHMLNMVFSESSMAVVGKTVATRQALDNLRNKVMSADRKTTEAPFHLQMLSDKHCR